MLCTCSSGCWSEDPHERPLFPDILAMLDQVTRSNFTQTPQDSFRTMQGHWQAEIEEKVQEIRTKETVSNEEVNGQKQEFLDVQLFDELEVV